MQTFSTEILINGIVANIQVKAMTYDSAQKKINKVLKGLRDRSFEVSLNDIEKL